MQFLSPLDGKKSVFSSFLELLLFLNAVIHKPVAQKQH